MCNTLLYAHLVCNAVLCAVGLSWLQSLYVYVYVCNVHLGLEIIVQTQLGFHHNLVHSVPFTHCRCRSLLLFLYPTECPDRCNQRFWVVCLWKEINDEYCSNCSRNLCSTLKCSWWFVFYFNVFPCAYHLITGLTQKL